jgi:hypothetical protein
MNGRHPTTPHPNAQKQPQPGQPGYGVGNETANRSVLTTILIGVASAAAGAIVVRILDRTVFSENQDEIDRLKQELADARAQAVGLPPAGGMHASLPAPVAPPPPGYIRLDVPKETMSEEFWARLAGED